MTNLYIVTIIKPSMAGRERLRLILSTFGREVLPGVFECYLTPDQHTRLRQHYGRFVLVERVDA